MSSALKIIVDHDNEGEDDFNEERFQADQELLSDFANKYWYDYRMILQIGQDLYPRDSDYSYKIVRISIFEEILYYNVIDSD